jgi:hypothetical protein
MTEEEIDDAYRMLGQQMVDDIRLNHLDASDFMLMCSHSLSRMVRKYSFKNIDTRDYLHMYVIQPTGKTLLHVPQDGTPFHKGRYLAITEP